MRMRRADVVAPDDLVGEVLELSEQQHKQLSWREVQSTLQPAVGQVSLGRARKAARLARKRQRTEW